MAASVGELDVFKTRAKIDSSAIFRAADPATLCIIHCAIGALLSVCLPSA